MPKFDTKNRQNQAKIWNTEPCTTLRKDVLARHEASAMHKEAVEQECACQIVKARGGIREAVQGQVEELALLSYFLASKCVQKREGTDISDYMKWLVVLQKMCC